MGEGTEIEEIETVDDNSTISKRDVKEFHEMAMELLEFNRALELHGLSVVSLFRDLMLRIHGIRL